MKGRGGGAEAAAPAAPAAWPRDPDAVGAGTVVGAPLEGAGGVGVGLGVMDGGLVPLELGVGGAAGVGTVVPAAGLGTGDGAGWSSATAAQTINSRGRALIQDSGFAD